MTRPGVPGSAGPVLLLHGQPGSARDWEKVRAAIGDRARTIAIDRPGWDGRSAPSGLAGNASAAVAVLDAERAGSATVVGHSFGAAIAAWLAAHHPERVEALVLAAPSANLASLNRLDRLLAMPLVGPVLAATTLAGIGAALTAPPLRERIGSRLSLDPRYLRASGRKLLSPGAWRSFSTEQRLLIRDLPLLERRLGAISAPTTIVIGTADRIVPPSSARALAGQISGAEVVQLPRATHLLPQERPEHLGEIIVAASRPR